MRNEIELYYDDEKKRDDKTNFNVFKFGENSSGRVPDISILKQEQDKIKEIFETSKRVLEFYELGLIKYLNARIKTIEQLIEAKDNEYISLEDSAKIQRMTGRIKELQRIVKRLERGDSIIDMAIEEELRQI